MSKDEFSTAGRTLFGEGWEARTATLLAVSTRTVRRWKSGERDVPEMVASALRALIAARMAARQPPRRGDRPQEVA